MVENTFLMAQLMAHLTPRANMACSMSHTDLQRASIYMREHTGKKED
jgi:hypothetical protein